jgi:hypothetical protein
MIPAFAGAAPSVMIDTIPSGGALFNLATVRLSYRDLDEVDAREVQAKIVSAILNAKQMAEQNAIKYICLLSTPGADRSFVIAEGHKELNLSRTNPSFTMLLYRGGNDTTGPITYSLDKVDSQREHAGVTLKKMAVPAGWTTVAWVYFNLSRIQDAAAKAGATRVFLESRGKGAVSPIVIPGVSNSFMVFDDDTTISATWDVPNTPEVHALPK